MGSTIGVTDQLLSRSFADVHTPALVYAAYLGLIFDSTEARRELDEGLVGLRIWGTY